MKKIVIILSAILAVTPCLGQENPREGSWIFWGYPQNYLENQSQVGFESVIDILETFPPSVELSPVRRNALITLDMLLHDKSNDKSEALFRFFENRFSATAASLEKGYSANDEGLEIYKMYNDGFILRSPSATVAIDLIRGGGSSGKHFISDSLIRRIASCCDLLLITHNHGDHADAGVIKIFLDAGKKVFAPNSGNNEPSSVKEVKLKIISGHQDEMANNIYHITFDEGYSVAHTGDQYNREDLKWISQLKESYQTDLLLVNCWTMELQRTISGFNPRYVITGHENEMEHSIDHREAYWMTMKKMQKSAYPYIIMTFGEKWVLRM